MRVGALVHAHLAVGAHRHDGSTGDGLVGHEVQVADDRQGAAARIGGEVARRARADGREVERDRRCIGRYPCHAGDRELGGGTGRLARGRGADGAGGEPRVQRSARGVEVDRVVGETELVGGGRPIDDRQLRMPFECRPQPCVGHRVLAVEQLVAGGERVVPRVELRLHLAQGDPEDVLHAFREQRVHHLVDRAIEAGDVPVRVVVATGHQGVVAECRRRHRLHVPVDELLDELGGLAGDGDLPVGGEGAWHRGDGAETDGVGHHEHALGRHRRRNLWVHGRCVRWCGPEDRAEQYRHEQCRT